MAADSQAYGLWGVISNSVAISHVAGVRRTERIFVWQSGTDNGFIAIAQVAGPPRAVTKNHRKKIVHWPEPHLYVAVVPIRVVSETRYPVSDRFDLPGRVGRRFGFSTQTLKNGFQRIDKAMAKRIYREVRSALPGSETPL